MLFVYYQTQTEIMAWTLKLPYTLACYASISKYIFTIYTPKTPISLLVCMDKFAESFSLELFDDERILKEHG